VRAIRQHAECAAPRGHHALEAAPHRGVAGRLGARARLTRAERGLDVGLRLAVRPRDAIRVRCLRCFLFCFARTVIVLIRACAAPARSRITRRRSGRPTHSSRSAGRSSSGCAKNAAAAEPAKVDKDKDKPAGEGVKAAPAAAPALAAGPHYRAARGGASIFDRARVRGGLTDNAHRRSRNRAGSR
jgi:hypothetical protein